MLRRIRLFSVFAFAVLGAFVRAAVPPAPSDAEALLLVVGDQHSAYERTAQFVALVDELRAAHPRLPIAVLINGDSLEYGNVIARRSAGAVDFAMFAALAKRVPTILNLGNHEPEFYDVAETVRRLEATGMTVISNLTASGDRKPFAPASTTLKLGAREAVVAGLTTDRLSTYRVAVRPSIDPADPVVWGKKNLPALLASTPLPIVLSHCGIGPDRALLGVVPEGTLFAGAHDHLRFVHTQGRTVYFHSGSWNDNVSFAWLLAGEPGEAPRWYVVPHALDSAAPADPELARLIERTVAEHITPAERVVVGRLPAALAPAEAARFAVRAARLATGADAAFIGATTFGAGLPAGDVTQLQLDACVRFDGTLFTAEIDADQLRALLAGANQGPDTSFAERQGENLVADTALPATIEPGRRYRIAVTDWVARNADKYLAAAGGAARVTLTEAPTLKLKAAVIAQLGNTAAGTVKPASETR